MAVLVTDKRIGEALDSVCRVSASPFMGTTHTVILAILCSWGLQFSTL